jgi:hypothetical protein
MTNFRTNAKQSLEQFLKDSFSADEVGQIVGVAAVVADGNGRIADDESCRRQDYQNLNKALGLIL